MADAAGERDKSKKDKKSKAGSNPPTEAKGKIDTPREEQKMEEAPASSRSSQGSSTVTEEEGQSNPSNAGDNPAL